MTDIQIPETKKVFIANLKTDPGNPNKMDKREMEAQKESIKRFGFIVPIITNRDYLIADGQHRYQAAKELGMNEVPVIALDVDEVDRRTIRQVLNKLRGAHDPLLDKEEYLFLDKEGSINELMLLLPDQAREIKLAIEENKGVQQDDFDEATEIEKARKTEIQKGDLFKLGEHTIMCGDSTNQKDIDSLLNGNKADMVFVDPPYNLAFAGTEGTFDVFENDKLSTDSYDEFIDKLMNSMIFNAKPTTSYYICIDYRKYHKWVNRIESEKDIELINCIVWDKVFAGLGYKYRFRHEFVIFAGDRDKINWYGSTTEEDVFKVNQISATKDEYLLDKKGLIMPLKDGSFLKIKVEAEKPARVPLMEKAEFTLRTSSQADADLFEGFSINNFSQRELEFSEGIVHPTMKPLLLIAKTIKNSTREGDLVVDYCGGSGSTLIAAEQTKRRCNIMEISPVYCQVIINRWEKLTGRKHEKAR